MRETSVVLSLLMFATPAIAGVVYEIDVTDHDHSPPKTETMQTAVEGRNLKLGIPSGGENGNGEMIYHGNRKEMVYIDHDRKTFFVIDEATMRQLANQMNEAMTMMEQALANVPEGQRAMVEEMMRKKIPQAQKTERPNTELRKTGETARHNGYPCVKYEVLREGQKIRELWVTDWTNVEGGAEVAELFYEMSAFFREMLDSLPKFADSGGSGHALEHMREMDGFPVITRELSGSGSIDSESSLKSVRSQNLDPDAFEPPSGYKRQEMFGGQ